jgi:hypothetical protein
MLGIDLPQIFGLACWISELFQTTNAIPNLEEIFWLIPWSKICLLQRKKKQAKI